jgi:hypothetical protein
MVHNPRQSLIRPVSGLGEKADVPALLRDVRFSRHPISGNCANERLMHRTNYRPYSITSARASRVGGTTKPSAFAVFRL